jgi:hypothetical protein
VKAYRMLKAGATKDAPKVDGVAMMARINKRLG